MADTRRELQRRERQLFNEVQELSQEETVAIEGGVRKWQRIHEVEGWDADDLETSDKGTTKLI